MKKALSWFLIPMIVLFLAGCDQLGIGEEDNLKTVFIGPEKVDCEGEGPQTCYLIKENPDDQYGLYYSEIDGFEFESGYEYELIISEEQVENPPVGGSSVNWTLEEVINKVPATGGAGEETVDVPDTAESEVMPEEESVEEISVPRAFVPISVEDMGVTTAVPADWPKIEDDPLLKDAWGPGQYRFIAFHSVAGDDVQQAMAQLLSTTVEDLENGAVDGEFWEEEIGDYHWAMYAINNPDVGLVQTVSMMEQEGTVYVVSLFIETEQKDAVLTPALENFAVEIEVVDAELDTGEVEAIEGEEAAQDSASVLIDTNWVLAAYADGREQLVDVTAEADVTVLFETNDRVSGFAGCNDFVSLYTIEGQKMAISLPAMTRKECVDPPGIMLQETGFLGNLTTVTSYQIEGVELQLLDDQGVVVLSFRSS